MFSLWNKTLFFPLLIPSLHHPSFLQFFGPDLVEA